MTQYKFLFYIKPILIDLSMVYGLLKVYLHGFLSVQEVDEKIYKRILVTDMCRQNFPIISLL